MIHTVKALGQIGLNYDAEAQELPDNAWSDAANVRFRHGQVERMKGEQKIFTTPSVAPYWLQPYYQGGKRYWVHAGVNAVFADDGTSRTTITPAVAPTGTVDNRWTGGVLNGVLVMNNGVDTPWHWGGTSVLAPLPNWPASTKAASIRPFKNVLVALSVTKTATKYAHMVKWSDAAVPGAVPQSWDHTDKTKLAGELDLAEEPSLLVDQLPMGDVNVIYKENSMYAMRATGGQDVFSFQRLPGSVGALAKGCIAQTPVGHVVLTHGDVILHSGQGPKSIIDGVMRRWLFRTIDSTNRARSFLVTNPPAKEVWVCFPELGAQACTLAAVWNWEALTWTVRTLRGVTYGAAGQLDASATLQWDQQNYTWEEAGTAWNEDELSPAQDRLLLCALAPRISAADVTGTIDGTAYTSHLERTGLSFGAPEQVKVVRGLSLRLTAAPGTKLQVQVGSSMSPEQTVQWASPVVYTVAQDGYNRVNTFATGRFLALRLTSLDNLPWRLTSMGWDVVAAGAY